MIIGFHCRGLHLHLNLLEVDYAPEVVGDHQVEVKIAGMHVQGSPFIVKAYDASCVIATDISPGTIAKLLYVPVDDSTGYSCKSCGKKTVNVEKEDKAPVMISKKSWEGIIKELKKAYEEKLTKLDDYQLISKLQNLRL